MAREDLDEDRLAEDPLERGIEPAERPSAALEPDTEHDAVGARLAQEEPDLPPGSPTADAEPVAHPFEGLGENPLRRTETGPPEQQADIAGGSVADAIREPGEAD